MKPPPLKTISPEAAWQAVEAGQAALIDVREPGEFDTARAPKSLNLPLSRFEERLADVPSGGDILVLCAHGPRADAACAILAENGRAGVVVEGGITAWQRRGLPIMAGARRVLPMERQVRLVAGLLVLTGVSLGWWAHPAFFLLAAFVGAGLTFSGLTRFCGMALVLARCPWNR